MIKMAFYSVRKAVAALFVVTIGVAAVSAQVNDDRIEELKRKYTWGSIYLTYGPVCDITQLLSKPESLEKINSVHPGAFVPTLASFFVRNRAANMRDGIAFLEINLNKQEAGYMKSGDANGVINRIPWGPRQVFQAADLFDRFLMGSSEFVAAYRIITDGSKNLTEAWTLVEKVRTSVYIPKEKLTFLDIGFRVLAENKAQELAALKSSNSPVYSSITDFVARFDSSFKNAISPSDQTRYVSNLIWVNGWLGKELLQVANNPYTDPDKIDLLKAGERLYPNFRQEVAYTVIEYPVGKETIITLDPLTLKGATGTATILRDDTGTRIKVNMTGLPKDVTALNLYAVDPAGAVTSLGPVVITDGVGTLASKTPMNKFMLVASPEATLSTYDPNTKVLFRSAVPAGFAVIPHTVTPLGEKVAATTTEGATPATTYSVQMLNIPGYKKGDDTKMKINFSGALAGARANVFITPRKDSPTEVRMRFHELKDAPAGQVFTLWAVSPDNQFVNLGQVVNAAGRNEAEIKSETSLKEFGLLITTEPAEGTMTSPTGPSIAIVEIGK